jgi:hypothetical protein
MKNKRTEIENRKVRRRISHLYHVNIKKYNRTSYVYYINTTYVLREHHKIHHRTSHV